MGSRVVVSLGSIEEMSMPQESPPPGLFEQLRRLRSARGFDAEATLQKKVQRINAYFAEHRLDAAVVGVSGGVDSAVALGLLVQASRVSSSSLQRVVAVLAPVHGRGATGQDTASAMGERVVAALGGERWTCDLTKVQAAYVSEMGKHSKSTPWSEGQLLSIVRTPAFYYAAAMLQAEGHRSLVVGTTNRDEGAYLGFFGKASDAMVDVQPISDLHKSEVYALAEILGVSKEVISAPPRGDVHDGRNDLEMIGAPYWAVELFLLARCAEVDVAVDTAEETALWNRYKRNIEAKHQENAHKYNVGNPSVHLDVHERSVPGGWT